MSEDPLHLSHLSRRSMLTGTLGALGTLTLPGATAWAAPADWSRAVIDSTMRRYTPATIGGWSYPQALYLYGQYLFYKRTGEKKYFDYVKTWVDRFVTDSGVSNSFTSLDSMRPGQLLPLLYNETGQAKYKTASDQLRKRFLTYPRTSDGGMFHATGKVGQLWCDGVFMAQPFLALYGQTFHDPAYSFEESAKNLVVYFSHLKSNNGLMYHAYDEDGSESWAKDSGHHSAYYWGRAIGWFGMAAIDLLEVLPTGHPRRQSLIGIVQYLATGYKRYQDAATGRWFQVVDRGSDSKNWTETSCSSMYTFMLSRGIERGYLSAATYQDTVTEGYRGVLAKVSLGTDGLTNITDISEGTNVGNLTYYYARARKTNDFHGLGAFLVMNEQLSK